jgi:UDP-glucose 4-epimerase
MNKHVLVVGGAGYIGSHMVKSLLEAGYQVSVLDNLSSGHRDAVLGGNFVLGDLSDAGLLEALFSGTRFDAVMHFAGLIQVAESVSRPDIYYANNVSYTLNLVDAMVRHSVPGLVFSSTAAIFGEPAYVPIDEAHPRAPINPYGRTKWMVEQILADYDRAFGLKSACLRYFNAAGADPSGLIGERHDPETHLIPIALEVAMGKRSRLSIYGDDYDTPDGTCIRDYIHVNDLCQAHLLAMRHLEDKRQSLAMNLGNGQGFSVLEVVESVRKITARPLTVEICPRRAGDPARLVADSRHAREVLGWNPAHPDLDSIVSDAWRWAGNYEQLKNRDRDKATV